MQFESGEREGTPPPTAWDRFNEAGDPLCMIPGTDVWIRSGQIFETDTVKGNTNLIITMKNPKDTSGQWIYYLHGESIKKVARDQFLKAVEWGDVQPRLLQEVDVERIAKCHIALDAIANRRSVRDQIDAMSETAELRAKGGM